MVGRGRDPPETSFSLGLISASLVHTKPKHVYHRAESSLAHILFVFEVGSKKKEETGKIEWKLDMLALL